MDFFKRIKLIEFGKKKSRILADIEEAAGEKLREYEGIG